MTTKAQQVRRDCYALGSGGFDLHRGLIWQTKRANARAYCTHTGRLLAERRNPGSNFQTDALYLYTDGSMLIVHRNVYKTLLVATKTTWPPEERPWTRQWTHL